MQGEPTQGIQYIREGLEAQLVRQAKVHRPWHLSLLAEAHVKLNEFEEGLACISEAFKIVEITNSRFWEAELHRLKGALLLQQATDNLNEAEDFFHEALNLARCQRAKSLELRAAASLARLWQCQGKRQDAYNLLAPVYNWFTEGLDTADLMDAKSLMDALSG